MQDTPTGLGASVHRASELLGSVLRLNLLWVLGMLAGGVLLGAGPATVAAYQVARAEQRGTSSRPWREFAAAYRAQFRSGNVLYLPVGAAAVMLAADARWSAQLPGGAGSAVRWLLLALALALAGAAVHLGPAFAHHDVAPLTCLRRAGALALRQAPTTVLLLALLDGWIQLLAAVPLVAVLGGVGGWVRLSSVLCLHAYQGTASPAPASSAPARPASVPTSSGPTNPTKES